ncbi:hypothetical protein NE236_29805 [Actinoallomurus purpureus]|uniref:hypothetical protein n=1 Tax=Actinoallomurus purpureus TaxID=478114 RepID=UPI0020924248|nr:hypothetical protein [Actinoallomurus purpureus]MCO6009172.1 hypothetical protein [Actinoallomurus purpureus]
MSPRLSGVAYLLIAMVAVNISNVQIQALVGMGFSALMVAGLLTATGGAAMNFPIRWVGFRTGLFKERRGIVCPVRWTGFRMNDSWQRRRKILLFTAVNLVLNVFYGLGVVNCPVPVFVALEVGGLVCTSAVQGFKQRGWKAFIWPAVTMAGVLLLERPGSGSLNMLGIAFAFLSGVGTAVRIVLTEKLEDDEAKLVRGYSGFIAGIGLILVAYMRGTSSPHLTVGLFGVLLLAALANTTIPSLAEVAATRKLTAATVNVIQGGLPAVALLITWLTAWRLPHLIEGVIEGIAITIVVIGAAGAAKAEAKAKAKEATAKASAQAVTASDEPLGAQPSEESDAQGGMSNAQNKKPKPQRGQRQRGQKKPFNVDRHRRTTEALRNRAQRRKAQRHKKKH